MKSLKGSRRSQEADCGARRASLLKFELGEWHAEIALLGGNLLRLRHRSGLELLRFPRSLAQYKEKPEVWGVPTLFPPGRISRGRFKFGGRSYQFPLNDALGENHMHGVASRRVWTLEDVGEDWVELSFENGPRRSCHSYFPHRFKISLRYLFRGSEVVQCVRVESFDSVSIPFGFGFHTAFRIPFGESGLEGARACVVKASVPDFHWTLREAFPDGSRSPFPKGQDWRGGFPPEGRSIFLHAPIAADRNGFRGAIIESPFDGARVLYEVGEEFKHWVLWNYCGDKGVFCPEPQTWMVDAPNSTLPASISGMGSLEPGELWRSHCSIRLEKLR